MRFFSKKNPAHSRDEDDSLRIIDDNTPFAVVEAFKTLYTKILYIPTYWYFSPILCIILYVICFISRCSRNISKHRKKFRKILTFYKKVCYNM